MYGLVGFFFGGGGGGGGEGKVWAPPPHRGGGELNILKQNCELVQQFILETK